MVGHQAKGIDLDAVDVLELREGFQVALVVTGLGKHDLPVVAALDHMMRVVLQNGSADPWHAGPPCGVVGYALMVSGVGGKINLSRIIPICPGFCGFWIAPYRVACQTYRAKGCL